MKHKRTNEERLAYQREYYYKNKEKRLKYQNNYFQKVVKPKSEQIKSKLQVVKDQFKKEKEDLITLMKQKTIEEKKLRSKNSLKNQLSPEEFRKHNNEINRNYYHRNFNRLKLRRKFYKIKKIERSVNSMSVSDFQVLNHSMDIMTKIDKISTEQEKRNVFLATFAAIYAFNEITEHSLLKADEVLYIDGVKMMSHFSGTDDKLKASFIKDRCKALYNVLVNSELKQSKEVVHFNKKVNEFLEEFRDFIVDIIGKNLNKIQNEINNKKKKDISEIAKEVIMDKLEKDTEKSHKEFVKNSIIPELEENSELIRDGHNMMMNLLANTTTNIEPDDDDQDFLFYKVGMNSLIHELMLDVIEMEKQGKLNAIDVIMRLHNIELLNNAHLFDEKDKILKSI